MEKKKVIKKKINRKDVIFIFFCIFFLAPLFFPLSANHTVVTKQKNYSDLINTKEIAALSVCEFVYNGIAQCMKDSGKPDYNVLYNSTVKVSVDADSISYNIDKENKIIKFIFPELTYENPVIDVDSVSLIPNKKDLFMDDVIALCREDALIETKKSEKLLASAQDNIRSIIEAWYSPVFQDYSFEYSFDSLEGGEMS